MLFNSVSVFLLPILFYVCIFFSHSSYHNLVNKDVYRMSHMSFRLVPNSVTLNDLERLRNRPNGGVISPNSVAFWADCVKVVEDIRILSAAEM